jgi:EAL domain-containing protein (putative c-di-GMP-specific phosphodiesterase class I)
VIYEARISGKLSECLKLESKLHTAWEQEQFELHYQPQINLRTNRIEGAEALLRWRDPDIGLIEPAVFIPALESSGLIDAVGAWVLKQATRDCKRWQALGLGPVRVAVNVSPLQLRQAAFAAAALKAAAGLTARGYGLDLEITESSLIQDVLPLTHMLRSLRAHGIRIALDDFGTGFSSLSLLAQLPVDILKIDRSFVHGLPHDRACLALTLSISQLARAFGLQIVAEGVETRAQLKLLRELHCQSAQGFLYSPACAAAQFEQLLRAAHRKTDGHARPARPAAAVPPA